MTDLLLPSLRESALGPIVVGATGGSGTRVIARILREAGLFTGIDLNESEDAWKLGEFSDCWINVALTHRGGLPHEVEQAMVGDLLALLEDHCAPIVAEPRPWGWKEPRSIYYVPFLHRHLPGLRFLHVIRDGRDMAFSQNQNQLRKHGAAAGIAHGPPAPVRSIGLWSLVNVTAARYGEERLRDRYLRIRFEDVCADPVAAAAGILDWANLDGDASAAVAAASPPAGLGRWRHEEPRLIAELERVAAEALAEFGYEPAAV